MLPLNTIPSCSKLRLLDPRARQWSDPAQALRLAFRNPARTVYGRDDSLMVLPALRTVIRSRGQGDGTGVRLLPAEAWPGPGVPARSLHPIFLAVRGCFLADTQRARHVV